MSLKLASRPDYEVLILAPVGRDAAAASDILIEAGIESSPFKFLSDLCERLENPVGSVLIAEEALNQENAECLKLVLSHQEPWSNLPIILMTSQVERLYKTEQILDTFVGQGSAISILERPFRIMTLLASVKVALQTRERQYQVRELMRQQAASVRQRDEFLSIASHELKTPITSLKLQVQMRKRFLKKGDPSVFSQDKVISLIEATETQLERLARLVDDMLDISRIVNGQLSIKQEYVKLPELVQEVLDSFSAQFEVAGCDVEFFLVDDVAGTWDRYRIEQVIANIFTNAIKYGAGKPVAITIQSQSGNAVLKVKDHGIGIAPENQERIFKRFERANAGLGVSGLGLGLYISRQIVDLHSGKIKVESTEGKGSTFIMELPLLAENTTNTMIASNGSSEKIARAIH